MEGPSGKAVEVGSFDESQRQKRPWSENRRKSMYLL
jgi:hypothetical protein